MTILALDIASLTGWCLNNNLYGTWDLKTRKDESMGMKLIRFKSKLKEIHASENLDLIVYERPAGKHANSIIHQAKLIAILEEFCEDLGISYSASSASEIKRFATGKGNASKEEMIQAAKDKYGYEGSDDNEADAIHLWNLTKNKL